MKFKKKSIYKNRFVFLMKYLKMGKILDVGNIGGIYGKGVSNSNYFKLKESLSNESELHGLDIYDPQKDKKKLYENQKKGNIEEGTDYPDKYFDTVYAGQILEHLGNPLSVLVEFNRILKDESILIVDIPNPYSLKRIIKWIIKREENIGDPTHLIFYTPVSLISLLNKAGFEILEIATDKKGVLFWKLFNNGFGSHTMCSAKKK